LKQSIPQIGYMLLKQRFLVNFAI